MVPVGSIDLPTLGLLQPTLYYGLPTDWFHAIASRITNIHSVGSLSYTGVNWWLGMDLNHLM
jgi:hypothetical protein